MNDLLIAYGLTIVFCVSMAALLCVYRYFLGNRLNTQANKLKSQMANIRQHVPELLEKRSEIVAGGLEDIGIDGIIDQLGIPSVFKPLAKGFVDRIIKDPKLIMGYAEKLGITLPKGGEGGEVSKGQEIDLL
jgi:hypothetical protein